MRIRVPFFEIGIKNYIYGDDVLSLAKAADKAAGLYGVEILLFVPYTDIRRVKDQTEAIRIFAPYMDTLYPGKGVGDVLPEAIKAAGAEGVMVNHSERPMTLAAIEKTINRARELSLLTFACAGSINEARALSCFVPDIINPEVPEEIGKERNGPSALFYEAAAAVRSLSPKTLLEDASGIRTAEEVYQSIVNGADGVGVSSGIMLSRHPEETLFRMVKSVAEASEVLKRRVI